MEGDSVKTAGKGVIHRLSLDALDRDHYGKKWPDVSSHLKHSRRIVDVNPEFTRNLKRKKERSESRKGGGSVVSVGKTSGQENECHLHWQDLKSIGYIDAEKEETLIIYMMSDDLAESREDNMVNEGPGTANAVTNDVSGYGYNNAEGMKFAKGVRWEVM
ncbi:18362_t:CDS:2 [Entrophospora sp. SA101]|nr:18362_t:CDS:2 [Entrophospora sp. SA101]